jgi:hypothetical protein
MDRYLTVGSADHRMQLLDAPLNDLYGDDAPGMNETARAILHAFGVGGGASANDNTQYGPANERANMPDAQAGTIGIAPDVDTGPRPPASEKGFSDYVPYIAIGGVTLLTLWLIFK